MNAEVEKCKESVRRLHGQHPNLTGAGVTFDDQGKIAIRVYGKTERDLDGVPSVFEGYAVVPVVVGDITPLVWNHEV